MTQEILIVDDTPINLVLFEGLIKKLANCGATTFADPVQGLMWAQAHTPDLIVLDYMMPNLNGIEFIQRLRSIPGKENLPILMVTANDQKDVRYQALDAGASDFLTKPIDRLEFLARARNLLALSAAQRKLSDHALTLAAEVRVATADILQREQETVIRLSKAAEYRDPETGAHILRMAHYSQLIARGIGVSAADQELLLHAAPLHDIGKVGISDNILLKPGRLLPEEFELMKKHANFGYEILKDSKSSILQAGAEIALGHHEKFNGSGYPQQLRGEAIPLFSRIVAVADVFDALTSARPYKPAWPLEAARAHIQANAGEHFDPACVAVFLELWDEVLLIRDRFNDKDSDWTTLLTTL